MHTWIARHPDDARYILTNGYDWTYFTVDDAPYFVRALRVHDGGATLVLSDATEEAWHPTSENTWIGPNEQGIDVLYTSVKSGFFARFSRHAQAALAPLLEEKDGAVWVILGKERTRLGTNVPEKHARV